MSRDYRVANDNMPASPAWPEADKPEARTNFNRRKAMAAAPLYLTAPSQLSPYTPVYQPSAETLAQRPDAPRFPFALTAWIASLAALIWASWTLPLNSLHMGAVIAAIVTSMIYLGSAARQNHKLGAELASLTALCALATGFYVAAIRFGVGIAPVLTASGLTGASLALALATGSALARRLTAIGAILACGLAIKDGATPLLLFALPAGIAVLFWESIRQRDALALGLAMAAGAIGVIAPIVSFVSAALVPAIFAACMICAASALAFRAARLMQDKAVPLGDQIAGFAATLFYISVIAIISFWIAPDQWPWTLGGMANGLVQPGSLALVSALLIGVALTELARVKTRPQSFLLSALTANLIALLCLLPFFPQVTSYLALAVEDGVNISGREMLALTLSGGLAGLLMFSLLNAVRRHFLGQIALTGLALLALFVIALDTLIIDGEHAAIAAIACVTAFFGRLAYKRKTA